MHQDGLVDVGASVVLGCKRPERVRKAAAGLMAWVPLMAILSYAVVVLLAQVQLNALPNIFQTIFG